MKLWKKIDWIILAIILLTIASGFFMAQRLPDSVPTHWNINGEVDGYGSKYVNLFLPTGLALVVYLLMSFLPAIDPLKKNYEQFARPYLYFKIFLTGFFICLYFFLLYASTRSVPPEGSLMFGIPISILFFLIGWVLPQIKRNFFIGIRTPWTLSSDEVWDKTHKIGGKIFMAFGVLSLVSVIFGSVVNFVVVIFGAILFAVVMMIYSYLAFRKYKK